MRWLPRLLVKSLKGGSRPTSLLLSSVFVSGLLRYLVLGSLSWFGLLAGLMLLMGLLLLPLRLSRIFGTFIQGKWELLLRTLSWRSDLLLIGVVQMSFGNVWSTGAEAGLLWRIIGQVAQLLPVFRHLSAGERYASGGGDSGAGLLGVAVRLYRVRQEDEVGVASAQYFVNSSLAPVLLFRRRVKSVADVFKGIRQHGFSQG